MRKPLNHHAVCLALIIWLFASWSGMHAHYCFDGKEPGISTHFDIVSGHPSHTAAEAHDDLDDEGFTPTLNKIFHLDSVIACVVFIVVLLQVIPRKTFYVINVPLTFQKPQSLQPPLRAPPANSR